MDFAAALPPVADRKPAPTTLHGRTLEDDYGWLRQKTAPETLAYLAAENAYTEAVMAPTADLQKDLYAEMLSHIKETDESVPYQDGDWLYFSRTVEGSQYPIHSRRASDDAPEEILLDVNALAQGQPYMAVGTMTVSPDGKLLAYSTDNTGFRQYTLHLRDLATNQDLTDTALRVGSITWAADSRTLFYTTEDEQTKRHDKLFRHLLGQPVSADALVYEELDERFNLGCGRTRDRQYILVESGSHTTNEYRFLPSADPTAALQLIAPRIDDQEYHPDHRDGSFYLRTNDKTDNFRLVITPVKAPGRENWAQIYMGNDPLEDFDLFQDFVVLSERQAGLPTLTIYDLEGIGRLESFRKIEFPEPTYTAEGSVNRQFRTTKFRYTYTSLVSPASVFEFDLTTSRSVMLKQQEVPGGFDRSRYASERLWVRAEDGTMVPVSIVYRRDTRTPGGNPLYVYGYGSYGFALPVGFSPVRLALLDRGVIIAYAHIRGGGELGDPWHDAGKMRTKNEHLH